MASDSEDSESFSGRLRVLELYSGIGGMHWALKESGVDYDVVQAMDVNTSANAIYQHNFPKVAVCASSIAKLSAEQLKKWSPNTILMSPPCQPFTRVGKKQDCQDPRTQSFLHLMDLLRKLDHKPEYILVENVKGFEVSETRSMLLDMLHDCKYAFQELLLTPLQFGVPNCRMRYYLIAKLKPLEFAFWTSDQILETVPIEALQWLRYRQSQEGSDCQASMTNCALCQARQSVVRSPSTSFVSIHHSISQAESSFQSGHICGHFRTKETSSHSGKSDQTPGHSSQSDLSSKTESKCEVSHGGGELCRCTKCSNNGAAETVSGQDLRTKSCVKCESVCRCCVQSCGDSKRRSTEGDGAALTIAEAGRNMRHCEEDDALVCADGTRLDQYLEKGDEEYFRPYLLPDKELRMFVIMDVVHRSFKKSSCFTKRYGHYIEGAGSLVMMTDDVQVVREASDFKSWAVEQKNREQWSDPELSILRRLKLRYFTPREVANLLCFPPEFEFPEGFSTIQCHRVLGNSLNVHVVSILIRLMLMEPGVI